MYLFYSSLHCHLDLFTRQPMLPLNMAVLKELVLSLDLSVLHQLGWPQQPVLPMDASVLQKHVLPPGHICFTAVCVLPSDVSFL